MSQTYRVTVWATWEHGKKWETIINTNDIESVRTNLKKKYTRFTIAEKK